LFISTIYPNFERFYSSKDIVQMNRLTTTLMAFLCFTSSLYAQDSTTTHRKTDLNILNHLDFGVTLGTTGIGMDLASPIGNNIQIRTGFAFMPHFNHTMHFGIEGYNDNGVLTETNFDRLAELMKGFTGYNIDSQIDMIGQPTYYNFKLLVDIFPFHNKKWHFTSGFYIGPSTIANAFNTTEDMPTLLAVGIYNNLYDFVKDEKYIDQPVYGDYYLDPTLGDALKEKMTGYGRMGIYIGDKTDGTPYMMEPGSDGMVKTKVKVNSFKPYIGFGYGNAKTNNKQYNISFDCGIMFWGGTPQIITHDRTDLADLASVNGKVGEYVNVIKVFKVFPVINLKISHRIF
jgi:hypothetical protein